MTTLTHTPVINRRNTNILPISNCQQLALTRSRISNVAHRRAGRSLTLERSRASACLARLSNPTATIDMDSFASASPVRAATALGLFLRDHAAPVGGGGYGQRRSCAAWSHHSLGLTVWGTAGCANHDADEQLAKMAIARSSSQSCRIARSTQAYHRSAAGLS
jgi:hypothetical protein